MIHVTCAIIIYENKILIVQRSENMKLPLKWEFPGGKVENFESLESCLKREILEEININIDIIQKLTPITHQYPENKIKLFPYLVKHKSGKILLTEHKTYKLVNPNELKNFDWAEADIPIIKEILKFNL